MNQQYKAICLAGYSPRVWHSPNAHNGKWLYMSITGSRKSSGVDLAILVSRSTRLNPSTGRAGIPYRGASCIMRKHEFRKGYMWLKFYIWTFWQKIEARARFVYFHPVSFLTSMTSLFFFVHTTHRHHRRQQQR
jgi:hypothetical protein